VLEVFVSDYLQVSSLLKLSIISGATFRGHILTKEI
jgi:hypothetical protein